MNARPTPAPGNSQVEPDVFRLGNVKDSQIILQTKINFHEESIGLERFLVPYDELELL